MNPGDYVATICEIIGFGVAALLVLCAAGFNTLQVCLDRRRIARSRRRSSSLAGSPNAGKAAKRADPAEPF